MPACENNEPIHVVTLTRWRLPNHINSLMHSFTLCIFLILHSLIHLFAHSLTHSLTRALIVFPLIVIFLHSLICSFILSFTHSCTDCISPNHFTPSVTHPITHCISNNHHIASVTHLLTHSRLFLPSTRWARWGHARGQRWRGDGYPDHTPGSDSGVLCQPQYAQEKPARKWVPVHLL